MSTNSLASIIGQLNAFQPPDQHISSSSPEKKDAKFAHFENVLESMRTRLRSLQAEDEQNSLEEDTKMVADSLQRPSPSEARLVKSIHDTEQAAEQLEASMTTKTEPDKENSGTSAEGSPSLSIATTSSLYDDLYFELTNLPDIEGEGEFDFDIDSDGVFDGTTEQTSLLDALAMLDGLSSPEEPLIRDNFAAENCNEAGLRRGKKTPSFRMGGAPMFQMEDAHLVAYPFDKNTRQGLFCVFDGFAGPDCARDATQALPRVLAAQLALHGGAEKLTDLTDILPKVFAETDTELSKHEDVGCTATVAFVWEHEDGIRYLQAANVGDSSIYLCRGGKAIMLNKEHKASSPMEHERIAAMGIDIAPTATRINGVAVARAFGAHFIKSKKLGIISEPYVSPVYELGTEDKFAIIASDGVWDVISGQDACDLIKNDPSAAEMATHLVRHAVSNRKCMDNVTAIVICF